MNAYGRRADWLAICCFTSLQRWLIDLKIQTKGRFPNIDQCIPWQESSRSLVRVSEDDGRFLLKHLTGWMGKSSELHPLTLDLATDRSIGKRLVQLRFRNATTWQSENANRPVVELTLSGSAFESLPLRAAMDPHHLLNALRFGHRTLHLQSAIGPAFCASGRSRYVWALHHESLTTLPTSRMQTISTDVAAAVV